jgi:hypothetical protein
VETFNYDSEFALYYRLIHRAAAALLTVRVAGPGSSAQQTVHGSTILAKYVTVWMGYGNAPGTASTCLHLTTRESKLDTVSRGANRGKSEGL